MHSWRSRDGADPACASRSIDRRRTPPYEQIVAQVRRSVERGTLAPGTRLPTVRALAERTGLVPNTVAKAYRELEARATSRAAAARARSSRLGRRATTLRTRREGTSSGHGARRRSSAAVEAVRRAAR